MQYISRKPTGYTLWLMFFFFPKKNALDLYGLKDDVNYIIYYLSETTIQVFTKRKITHTEAFNMNLQYHNIVQNETVIKVGISSKAQ